MVSYGIETRNITPIEPVPLAGYGYYLPNNRMSTGVASELVASALVIEDEVKRVALCGVDLLSIDQSTVAAIQTKVSRVDNLPTTVMINASHNHSGPATRVLHGAGGYNTDYIQNNLIPNLSDAILTATDHMQPGEIGIARASAPGLSFNRTGGASLDDRLTAIRLDCEDVHIAGAHFACHPTNLGPKSTVISPDYPGFARNTLAQDTFVQNTLWLTGSAGDINPATRKDPNCQRSLSEARDMGVALGHLAADLYQQAKVSEGELGIYSTTVSLPLNTNFELNPQEELNAFREARSIPLSNDLSAVKRWLTDMASLINDSTEEKIEVPITVLHIGKLIFAGFGAEIYNATGLKIEAAFPGFNIVTMMNCNAHEGYIPTEDAYEGQGYAPRTSAFAFGRRPLRSDSEPIFRNAAIAAINTALES